jgi:hypothetical protein
LSSASNQKQLAAARRILSDWQRQPFSGNYSRTTVEQMEVHANLLQSFMAKMEPFDCFQVARWRPGENQLSDVIAALFDEGWGHGFSKGILRQLLTHFAVASKRQAHQRAVAQIQACLDAHEGRLFVRREQRGDSSRADIDIYRGDFLVRIEHKIRGGRETEVGGIAQSKRLWEDSRKRAASIGIPEANVLAIMLSPESRKAKDESFLAMSFRDFAAAVTTSLKGNDSAPAVSILGFVNFYGRVI